MQEKDKKNLLVVVLGPTASGKTAVAVELALALGCAVVSADSRQLFREIPVGTAAPSKDEQRGVPHHFIGSHSVKEPYDAGRYSREALAALETLFLQKNVQVLCGGSGMYIDAVCRGFDELPDRDEELRSSLQRIFETEGIGALQEKLRVLDPEHYAAVDRQNPHRLMRAIEVCVVSGKPYSEQRKGQAADRPFRVVKIGLELERERLYDRINRRVDEMMANGLEEEARAVYEWRDCNALQTVGYKEMFAYFEGKTGRAEAMELIRQHTRNFARRQMTWFRRDKDIHWFAPGDTVKMLALVQSMLAY